MLELIKNKNRRLKTTHSSKWFFWIVTAFIICFFAYISSNINFSLTDITYNDHHVYAVWYPIYKVASGQTIGVDFDCIYGFYAYIVVPILNLFSKVDQQSFSVFISIILSINAISYYMFGYKFIDNKFFAFVCGTLASLYGPYGFLSTEVYFQYFPLRSIFISFILIAICIFDNVKKHKARLYIFMCLLSAVAIVWNFESGIIAAIIWIGYLSYRKIYKYGITDKKTIKTIFGLLLSFIISVALFVIFIEVLTFYRADTFIGIDKIFFGIKAFEGTGFFMLPIQIDIWIILVMIIGLGLFYSIEKIGIKPISQNNAVKKYSALFAVSIASAGAFSYFIGRSNISNAYVITPYCLIICGLLIEILIPKISDKKDEFKVKFLKLTKNIFDCVKAFICFSFIALVICQMLFKFQNAGCYLYTLLNPKQNSAFNVTDTADIFKSFVSSKDDTQSNIYKAAKKIKQWSVKYCNGSTPHLLITYSLYIEEILEQPSIDIKCEKIDCFYYENVKTIINLIKNNPNECFVIDTNVLNLLCECYPEEMETFKSQYKLTDQVNFHYDYYLYLPNSNSKAVKP